MHVCNIKELHWAPLVFYTFLGCDGFYVYFTLKSFFAVVISFYFFFKGKFLLIIVNKFFVRCNTLFNHPGISNFNKVYLVY